MIGDQFPHLIDRHVGARLATLRQNAGLDQDRLALAVGLTPHQIDEYEHGASRITGAELHRLCEVLECPISALFEGWETLSRATSSTEPRSLRQVKACLRRAWPSGASE